MKVTKDKVRELIYNSNGKIFSVVFIKKDGTIRKMNCRTKVTKHLKGGSLKFSPSSKGLCVVYDLQKKAYRMINLNTIINIKMEGSNYDVR